MLFKKYVQVNGVIHCISGLRIGGSGGQISIGDVDLTVIKHPLTNQPYIPGSSLKGKLRSLLESIQVNSSKNGNKTEIDPCGCGKCMVCRVFGPHKNSDHGLGATRLLVRDAALTQTWQVKFADLYGKGQTFFEEKTENIINRSTKVAEHPRILERVPAGVEFDFNLTLRVFEGDKETEILALIQKSLQMLQNDYLGGSGSRGYGKVEFRGIKKDGVDWPLPKE